MFVSFVVFIFIRLSVQIRNLLLKFETATMVNTAIPVIHFWKDLIIISMPDLKLCLYHIGRGNWRLYCLYILLLFLCTTVMHNNVQYVQF